MPPAFTFDLIIVTPEKTVFSGDVARLTLPGKDGELTIEPSHTALITALAPGELSYVDATTGSISFLAIGAGFAEIEDNKVRVLTSLAASENEIDEDSLKKAMERAQETLKGIDINENTDEAAKLQAIINQSIAQINFKLKRRKLQ